MIREFISNHEMLIKILAEADPEMHVFASSNKDLRKKLGIIISRLVDKQKE